MITNYPLRLVSGCVDLPFERLFLDIGHFGDARGHTSDRKCGLGHLKSEFFLGSTAERKAHIEIESAGYRGYLKHCYSL